MSLTEGGLTGPINVRTNVACSARSFMIKNLILFDDHDIMVLLIAYFMILVEGKV